MHVAVESVMLRRPAWTAVALLGLLLLAACSEETLELQEPARILYFQGEALEDQGLYSEAVTNYKKIVEQYSGTRLAVFSYLKLADLYVLQENWNDAETNYRLYLVSNPGSHLTSYALYRLLYVNNQKTYTGLIFKNREIDRGTAPNKNIILDYKRFYLLYPHSVYMAEIEPVYRDARATLAAHEVMVGDFYFKREQFNAAAGRYWFLLRNYPEFPEGRLVLKKLIEAYRRNQQPDQAAEMQRIYDALYAKGGAPLDVDTN